MMVGHAARDELNLVVLLGSVTTRQVAGQVSLTPILPVVVNRDDSQLRVFGIMRFLVAPTLNLAFALKGSDHPSKRTCQTIETAIFMKNVRSVFTLACNWVTCMFAIEADDIVKLLRVVLVYM